MKSSKKAATKYLFTFIIFLTTLGGCQSTSNKDYGIDKATDLLAQSVKGSVSNYYYETKSKVIITDKGKVTKKYIDQVHFEIERQTINVNEKGDIQFRIVTSNKEGNMALKDLAFLEPGQELFEMVDKYGKPLIVKDISIGSLYYIPRIVLPKEKVKIGDMWSYKGRWISEDTGWPFELLITSKLKSWEDCDGLLCALITSDGQVALPQDFPLKATLKSVIKGTYYYSPVAFEVLWGESESDESFYIEPIDKEIKVKSRSCSYKTDYSKKCK